MNAGVVFWHRVEHRFGWNGGDIIGVDHPDGETLIAFKCRGCGKVSGHFRYRPELEEIFG